jgi:hypothetical protein
MSVENIETALLYEADMIMKDINEARTLAKLMKTREALVKFRQDVLNVGSPQKAKQKLVFLEARWNRQFRIWKSRGY